MKVVAYHVTGIEANGRRFKLVYSANTAGLFMVFGINLYRGTVWEVYDSGKRHAIKRVWN